MTGPRRRARFLPLALLVLLACLVGLGEPAAAPAQEAETKEPGAPYVPTAMNPVEEMLQLADVTASDTVYDLGSGDGRLPIAAARLYGAHAVGVELQPDLVERARWNARTAGVDGRVRIVQGDLFETDLRPATVVTLYLFPEMNRKLRSKLLTQLEPGNRVVAHDFDMGEWKADSTARVPGTEGGPGGQGDVPPTDEAEQNAVVDSVTAVLDRSLEEFDVPPTDPIPGPATLYRWVIPADVGGRWRVRLPDGRTGRLRLDQRYQEVRVVSTGGAIAGADVRVRGRDVELGLDTTDGDTLRLTGTARDDRMEGAGPATGGWSAERVEDTDPSITGWTERGEAAGAVP